MTRPPSRTNCRILFPFLISSVIPFHGVDFLSIIQITGQITTYPLLERKSVWDHVQRKGRFSFTILSFIKDGSGASGLLQTVKPRQCGNVKRGGSAFVFLSVYWMFFM